MLLSNDSTADVHRSKSSFASSLVCVSGSATTQLSLSHLCARHFTRNDSNIAYQHIFSSLSCTLAPGSCEEGCKPLLYHVCLLVSRVRAYLSTNQHTALCITYYVLRHFHKLLTQIKPFITERRRRSV